MLGTTIISMAIILAMLAGWVLVQHLARTFAARHPEFGPVREEGGGCGTSCGCALSGRCQRERETHPRTHPV